MFHLLESQKWKTHRLWFHNDQTLIRNKAADMRISCMHPAVLSVFPRYTVKWRGLGVHQAGGPVKPLIWAAHWED